MISNLRKVCTKLVLATLLGGTLLPSMAVSAAPAAPNAVIRIDGSTTLYPFTNASTFQFNASGNTAQILGYTGSGHGQTSVANTYVEVGASSSNCGAGNMFVPTSGAFTTASYATSGVTSPKTCPGAAPGTQGNLKDNPVGLDMP